MTIEDTFPELSPAGNYLLVGLVGLTGIMGIAYFTFLQEVPLQDGSIVGCTNFQIDNGDCQQGIINHMLYYNSDFNWDWSKHPIKWRAISKDMERQLQKVYQTKGVTAPASSQL